MLVFGPCNLIQNTAFSLKKLNAHKSDKCLNIETLWQLSSGLCINAIMSIDALSH